MTPDDIRQIADWLAEAGLAELELTGPGTRLKLTVGAVRPADAAGPAPTLPGVVAPGTGLFMAVHPSRDAAFVSPGQRVMAGQLVALLQVGALLQPVAAPADGIVGHCLAAPGTLVGFGTPLMDFTPDPLQDRSSP
ncbi:MAG: acetyl-CoA carboxylase biotin carboxyl carrier protein subunit [Pseudomonadota bacterium]